MARTLNDWLKIAKGLQVYQDNKDPNICDIISSSSSDSSRKLAHHSLPRLCNLSSECLPTLETILNHPAVSQEDVMITCQDTVQIVVKFDMDVRITVDLCSGKCFSDPYLDSVRDVDSLLAVLEDPHLVKVVTRP